jgi:hypothetical protein
VAAVGFAGHGARRHVHDALVHERRTYFQRVEHRRAIDLRVQIFRQVRQLIRSHCGRDDVLIGNV